MNDLFGASFGTVEPRADIVREAVSSITMIIRQQRYDTSWGVRLTKHSLSGLEKALRYIQRHILVEQSGQSLKI